MNRKKEVPEVEKMAYDAARTAVDVARLQYSQDLRSNGQDYSNLNSTNAQNIVNQILNQKQNAFTQVSADMARTNDMTTNIKLYQTRTADTDMLASQIANQNSMAKSQVADDLAATQRQFEINEWYAYKKQETTGMLMGVAIGLGILLILVASMKMGLIAPAMFNIGAAITVICIVIWVYWRISYNGHGRDPMLWHRRRFDAPKTAPATTICNPLANTLAAEFGEGAACLSVLEGKFQDLLNTTTQDIMNYQETPAASKGLCSPKEGFVATTM